MWYISIKNLFRETIKLQGLVSSKSRFYLASGKIYLPVKVLFVNNGSYLMMNDFLISEEWLQFTGCDSK